MISVVAMVKQVYHGYIGYHSNQNIFFKVSIQSRILCTKFGIVKITFSKDINFVTKVYRYISSL